MRATAVRCGYAVEWNRRELTLPRYVETTHDTEKNYPPAWTDEDVRRVVRAAGIFAREVATGAQRSARTGRR